MDPDSEARQDRRPHAPLVMKWSVFLAAASGVAYMCLLIVRPFFGVLTWSLVLAIASYPLHQRLVRRTGRIVLSAFMTSALVVLALLVPLVFIGGVAIHQLLSLGDSLREAVLDPAGMSQRVAAMFAPLAQRFGLQGDAIVTWVNSQTAEWVAGAGQQTMSAAAGVAEALLSFVFAAIATFLLLRHGERLVALIPDLLPFERPRSEALLTRIRNVVQASMYGVVAIATIQGVLCGGMFWLLGVPGAALWGLVTMFASLVPFFGTAAVWGPATVYLVATGAWAKAIVLLVWGAAVVSSVDNVLRPHLVAGRVRLSGLAMFVAMLGGLRAFGAVGIIAGPVVFAAAAAIVAVLRDTPPPHGLGPEAAARPNAVTSVLHQPGDSVEAAGPSTRHRSTRSGDRFERARQFPRR